ncbi:MAG TPA: DUF2244 domain-containing protein [Burkholderiales bacterium]|nr:DUF2244 domain-containing protein [Burkholderiales bacterium]
MQCADAENAGAFTLTAKRYNSLSTSGRYLVFGFIFIVSFGISLAFAVFGAWPVLPFAGLEMLVLFLAFRYIERRSDDYERLSISGDKLLVEYLEHGRLNRFELNRYWAQVVCDAAGSRLALRSHGREVEFGHYLTQQERVKLARQLKERIRQP